MIENRFRAWYRSDWTRPLILAHRGDSFHAPENTLDAAELGFGSGADGWELDVRLTRDGVPVVLHDDSLLRTTDVARRFAGDPRASSGFLVGEFLLGEVKTLDAGSWFVDPGGGPRSASDFGTLESLPEADRTRFGSGSIRVPTLAEALALTLDLDWLINVEIKPGGGDREWSVRAVLETIRDAGATGRVTVSSFDHAVVSQVAESEPALATGALVDGSIECSGLELLGALGADALHAPASALGPTTAGVPVLVYTVNDGSPGGLASRLAESGVAGLFTDDPASLVSKVGFTPSSTRT